MQKEQLIKWSNPRNIDLSRPYIYFIRVYSGKNEYRYVGKGSSPSRMDAYNRNVVRALAGEPKRPARKRNGEAQNEGNIKFRYVHLVLAVAAKNGWKIEHYPLENCEKNEHKDLEKLRIQELECTMNYGESWFVGDFEELAITIE